MSTLQSLRNGDVDQSLSELMEQVREEPDQPKHRIFLFQLLTVAGQWDRALTQLHVAEELDPVAGVMAKAYQEILQCEALRGQVFRGERTPLVFGDPQPWVAQLIEALRLRASGQQEAAEQLRQQAFEDAPPTTGTLSVARSGEQDSACEETPFQWIADGDNRLGPVLEMIVNGRYYWAPFDRIAEVVIEPPTDLRDLVWAPAHFRWANSGDAVGVIPTRYTNSELEDDDAIRLSRKTSWRQTGPNAYEGLGQRVLVTDEQEHGLLDIRRIVLNSTPRDES